MKKYLILLPFILMVFAYGCATSSDVNQVERQTAATNAQLRDVQGNIDNINYFLQAENKRTKESFDLLKSSLSQINDSLKALSDQTNTILRNQADLGSRVFSSNVGEVSKGEIDDIRHELSQVDQKLDAMKALLMQAEAQQSQTPAQGQSGAAATGAAGAAGQAGTTGGAAPSGQAGATGATAPDPTQMYRQAYVDYISGNYDIAISEFREYLKDFPDAAFAANAQFWIGESLYSLKKYDKALSEFEKVIKNYPNSSKAADAMVKKGYTLDALKRPLEAKAAYEKVIKDYPNSDAAKLAGERLERER